MPIVFLYACSPTKYVPEDRFLLNKVHVKTLGKGTLRSDVKRRVRITMRPNSRFAGLFRLKLVKYNMSKERENTAFRRWLKRTGQAPVIYDPYNLSKAHENVTSFLNSKGYYSPEITDTVIFRRNRAWVKMFITPGPITEIKDFSYVDKFGFESGGWVKRSLVDTSDVMKEILSDSSSSFIRKGAPLDQSIMDKESQRITQMLRNKGYYFFDENLVRYAADTTSFGETKALLQIRINDNKTDSSAYVRYKIKNISINTDKKIVGLDEMDGIKYDTMKYKDYTVLYHNKMKIKPKLLAETIQFKQGDDYSLQQETSTRSRLQALALFSHSKIDFVKTKNSFGENLLDCNIELTQLKRQSYGIEIEGNNYSRNLGAGIKLSYGHRNLFKGGESFSWDFWVSTRKEEDRTNSLLNTYEYGTQMKLISPQFWLPFLQFSEFRRNYSPRTSLSWSYSDEQTPYYDRKILGGKYGYLWRNKKETLNYTFNLFDVNYVHMGNVDSAFVNNLKNRYIKSSYESHFIWGSSLSLIYRNERTRFNYDSFRIRMKFVGNTLHALSSILPIKEETKDNETYQKLWGVRYAQFMKGDMEYSHRIYINKGNNIVYRFFVGLGYSYGNMKALPFQEAYYCGGSNDIRAWHARTIGPGGYGASTRYPNSVGEIKLAANLEYRFKMFAYVNGALFFDAGNVWMIDDYNEEALKEAKFGESFYKQIAMGTGAGVRVDANIAVFRIDWGIKAVDPAQKGKFVLTDNGKWLRNTVLQFAIGYPF